MGRRDAAVAVLLAVVLLAPGAFAQSARYVGIVDDYRRGEFDGAVAALRRLPADEVYRGAKELLRSSLRPFRRDVVQALLALHTESAFAEGRSVGCGALRGDFQPDSKDGEGLLIGPSFLGAALIEALKSRNPNEEFLLTWYLTVISHSHQAYPGDVLCFQNAPARIQRHPEMQLALGAMHEKTWLNLQSEGWTLPIFKPSLQSAKRAYRAALKAAPRLDEARLRLGRVLAMEAKPDAALEVFREVQDRLDGGFAYLVRLFEGEAYEQLGDVKHAADAYTAAHAMMPKAESAIMALANIAYMQGRRAEALELLGRSKNAEAAGESLLDPWNWYAQGLDPWSWYNQGGTSWRFPGYLAHMRALVKGPR